MLLNMKNKIFYIAILVIFVLTSSLVLTAFIDFQSIKPTENEVEKSSDTIISYKNPCLDGDIVDMINQLNESDTYDYIKTLSDFGPRVTGTAGCNQAAEYIYNEFSNMGLDASLDEWRRLGLKSQNVIGTLNGIDSSSDAIFIVCAHYDTVEGAPGANDDGSGVGIMLSIADILSKYSFNHTIKFIAFAAEELGRYGSQDYARKACDRNENMIAAINLDTLGYTETEKGGQSIQMLCPERNMWISTFFQNVAEVYASYIHLSVEVLPDHPCDHDAFIQFGYDAVMLMQYDDVKYMHTPDDTIEHINFTYLNKVTKLVLTTISTLADKPIDLQVRIVTPMEDSFYLFDKRIFKHSKLYLSRARFGRTYVLGSCVVRISIDTDEEIDKIIYCVDDFHQLVYKTDYYPDATLEWRLRGYDSALVGKHKLGVYVYTVSGEVAYDEMDITAFTINRYYW